MSHLTAPKGYDGGMAATIVQEPEPEVLTAADRCDRCGSQAFLSVMHQDWPQELMFCAHHGREYIPALLLIEDVWVHDETERLINMEASV